MAGDDAQPGRRSATTGEPAAGEPSPRPEQDTVWRSDMVDVTSMSLAELVEVTATEDTPLARTLRRIADDLADPGEPVAGFNSAL